jgi:hypothetical protein
MNQNQLTLQPVFHNIHVERTPRASQHCLAKDCGHNQIKLLGAAGSRNLFRDPLWIIEALQPIPQILLLFLIQIVGQQALMALCDIGRDE